MFTVEQMLKDAIEAGTRQATQDVRRKLRDACLVAPCYENPFGYVAGIEEKIDEILGLLRPSITAVEHDKVYRRMANTLRGGNGKDG